MCYSGFLEQEDASTTRQETASSLIAATHHESLEIGSPPLRKTVTDLPVVVDAMILVELLRTAWWRESIVQSFLQPLDFVFPWLEVVAGSIYRDGQCR